METLVLKHPLKKCAACSEQMPTRGESLFCLRCGWVSLSQKVDFDEQEDESMQWKLRHTFLAQLSQNLQVHQELLQEEQEFSARLSEIKKNSLELNTTLLEVFGELERVEEEIAAIEAFINKVNFDPGDAFWDKIEDRRAELDDWQSEDHPYFMGNLLGKTIQIISSDKLKNPFNLAVGFSRSPVMLIEQAEVILKITLNPKEMTFFKNKWWKQDCDLPLNLEGEWHIVLTSFKSNKINGSQVDVCFDPKFPRPEKI